MLYSNVNLKAEERKFDFGTIYQVSAGEKGRGRKLLTLTCPKDVVVPEEKLVKELTVGMTKSGKPRLFAKKDGDMYLLLSAQGGYTRRGCGTLYTLAGHLGDVSVLASGNGADGDAGRIGFWDVLLLKVNVPETVIRVRTSGAGYGTPSDFYLVKNGSVFHATTDTVGDMYDALGLDMPFTARNGIVREEWERIFRE